MEVTSSDKHSSLLRGGISYSHESFLTLTAVFKLLLVLVFILRVGWLLSFPKRQVEVTSSDKHSSLLRGGINYTPKSLITLKHFLNYYF